MDFSEQDYEETVESIAKEILDDCGAEITDEVQERIFEDVDGNAYVIYYAGNDVVKQASDNWPSGSSDWREIIAMAGDDVSDDKLKTIAAFMAMERDVQAKLQEFIDELPECESCGEPVTEERNGKPYCQVCAPLAYPEPDLDMDAFYSPSGILGSKTSASFCHRFLGDFDSDDEALAAIRAKGKEENWFPNVWFIDDHGGHRLEENFDWDK